MDTDWTTRRVRILADLSAEQADRLLASGAVEEHPAGAVLMREGERGDAMYVVEAGYLEAIHETPDGRVVALERVGPGHQVGEMALLQPDGRRNATVRAHTDVRLLKIGHEALQRVLDADHPLKRRVTAHRDAQILHVLTRRSALVRALSEAKVGVTQRTLQAGEVLVRKGDPPGPAFLVLQGSLILPSDEVPGAAEWRTGEGTCVGERSILEGQPRAATLVAETDTTVLVIDAADLRQLVQESPEWRDHIQALQRVYELPNLGYATQFSGTAGGKDTLTTVYDLPDRRRVLFTRVVGDDLFSVDVAGAEAADEVAWRDEACDVVLRLSPTGALVGGRVQGGWAGQVALARRVLDDPLLLPEELARFERAGALGHTHPPGETLACACLVVPERRVRECIDEGLDTLGAIRDRLGCGTVCGGCVPGLATLLEDGVWGAAELVSREEVSPGVFHLRLSVPPGERHPALPGQYLLVRGDLHGYPVQRAYTLLRADGATYDIAVKRESRGLFSRWITGVELPASLRVSRPGGDVVLRDDMAEVVCLVAGVGVTPALAFAREIAERPLPTRLLIHYSARTTADLAFADELTALGAANPRIAVEFRTTSTDGRMPTEDLRRLAAAHPDAWFHLCGPPAYLRLCREALREAGIPERRVLVEVFGTNGGEGSLQPSPGGASDYTDWTWDSAIFAPPRRFRHQAHAALRYTMRAQRLLWQRVGSAFARTPDVDPRLPVLPLGAVRSYVHGFERFAIDHFEGLGARYADRATTADPFHPDGDTFVVLTATPALVHGSPIRSPWRSVYDGVFLPIHVVRGLTATREVLEALDHFDRGPMPFHFLQQTLGSAGELTAGHDAAGLLVGRHHDNLTWREDRDLGLRALVPASLERSAAELPAVLERPLAALAERARRAPDLPFDAHQLTARVALRMVCSALFGPTAVDAIEPAAAPIAAVARGLGDSLEDLFAGRTGAREVIATHAQALETVKALREAVHGARGRMSPEEVERPLVRRLLDCPDDERSLERLYTTLVSLLVAGHETTGTILAWALYQLGRERALSASVVAEVDGWREAHAGAPVGLLAQNHRPLTLALMFELYRRYPPVAQTVRTARQDGVMPADPNTGAGAFRYAAGTPVMVSVAAIHRDPRWWPDPDRFDPTRFLAGASPGSSAEAQGRVVRDNARRWEEGYRLIPFLRGPGTCIGRGLNQVEFFAFLDAFLSRFQISLVDPTRVVEARGSTISGPAPGSIAVTVRLRHSTAEVSR